MKKQIIIGLFSSRLEERVQAALFARKFAMDNDKAIQRRIVEIDEELVEFFDQPIKEHS